MPFPTKTALAVLGLGAAVSVGMAVMGGPDMPASSAPGTTQEVEGEAGGEAAPLLVFARPEGDPLVVRGPECYEDSRGNDVVIHPNDDTASDCFVLRNGGRDLVDLRRRSRDESVYIRIAGKPDSFQSIALGPADDVVEIDGSTNLRISAEGEQDTVLALPDMTGVDIRFRQRGDDVLVETPRGTITLVRQSGSTASGPISHIMLRGGVVLGRSQIRVQSVVGQGTPGNDVIRDTDSDDVIYPGLGDDTITLLGGENRIHYEGGNDRINSAGDRDSHNTLFVPFLQEEVVIRPSPDRRDVVVETPVGEVRMELQMFYPVEDPRAPVQALVFSDGPIDSRAIRTLAEAFEGADDNELNNARTRLRN